MIQINQSRPSAYYAVAKGRYIGIFDNWAETREQIWRFHLRRFRKYYCWNDCLQYLKGEGLTEQDFHHDCGRSHNEKYHEDKRYYAVAKGRNVGLFTLWSDCKNEVLGFPGAEYKVFACRYDAKQFLRRSGQRFYHKDEAQFEIPNPLIDVQLIRDIYGRVDVYVATHIFAEKFAEGPVGIGIFWGPNHSLNLTTVITITSTHFIADLQAVIIACRIALDFKINQFNICTDSTYLINCIAGWWHAWMSNGFRDWSNMPVTNYEVYDELRNCLNQLDIYFKYVPQYSGDDGIIEAHTLAQNYIAETPVEGISPCDSEEGVFV